MELKQAIEKILEGQAVLFAGAGFSWGAKNVKGEVPAANKLKKALLRDMGLDETLDYGLEQIAEYYKNKKSDSELVLKLKEQYNVLQVAEHHKQIMMLPWKRIYTTNYDRVVEKASDECGTGIKRTAIVLSDDFEGTDKNNICIHINGYIEHLNEEKLNNEFKLTDKSYSCDTLLGNPWFEFMVNDFESAATIIVIGYSMKFDIDIKRLFAAPNISKKVVFIDAPDLDEISKGLLEGYGKCYTIGIEEFSAQANAVKDSYVPSMDFSYKSFKYMYRDTFSSITPSFEEIVQFYTEGKTCDKLFEKDKFGAYVYVLERKAMNFFMKNYRNNKVFVALSNLGNGKTIFLQLIENELRKEDVKVYIYTHRYDWIDEEIEKICKERKKCVVIIDNYPGHLDILNKFYQYGHRNITFLLTARNGVNLMFCKKLERVLHVEATDIRPLYLNQLQEDEIRSLAQILEDNALLTDEMYSDIIHKGIGDFVKDDCKASFSNLLLKLFEASSIKKKLESLYKGLESMQNEKIKKVVIFSLLKNVSNYDLSFYEILDLFCADYIALMRNDIEFMAEIFIQDEDGINVRSSIISLELIKVLLK